MEISSLTSSEQFQSLQRLRYLNTCSTIYFQQRAYKKTQRLIPLTKEIENAMINFDDLENGTNFPERFTFNTMSIMSLVKGEVYNILQKLPISHQLIYREEIDDIIKKSLDDFGTKLENVVLHNANDEFEITVKGVTTEDQHKNRPFAEHIQKLQHRITKLEKRLRFLLKHFPKLKLIQPKNVKMMDELNSINKANSETKSESLKTKNNKNGDKEIMCNIYDDLFYRKREYTLNLLNYKKSLESFVLNNQNPKWNPYVMPAHNVLHPQENIKKLSMFLTS